MSKAGSLASTDAICSQAQNVVKELGRRLRPPRGSKQQRMPATTDFLGRETPLESVRPRRFNPATARARGQANTGGTSWPRVRCAAPRKRRSRRRSGTRRKKAVPPSRRSRWPGSQPNRARTPSARRASRTTHRWRGLATRSGPRRDAA